MSARALPTQPFDVKSIKHLVDEVIAAQLEGSYIPGVVVAVVKAPDPTVPGAQPLIWSQGYGAADRDSGAPVDPDRTLFRLGSISKLLTWTAVMQLVERQQLDLSEDINAYLRAPIPATFPEPVTLKHLLTHTAGFEAGNYGYSAAPQGCGKDALAETLRRHLPARIRPPVGDFTRGDGALYTNSAAALAGHVIAERSGHAFEDYVDRNIFEPLGMTHSTFREPLPRALHEHLASGYLISADERQTCYRQLGFEHYCPIAPATSASASAIDMTRFMLAHLQLGRIDGSRILQEETVQLMHSRVLSPHPHVNGATYGFMEKYMNGRRALWHQGATLQFYAELYLVPEERVGLFVAYNSRPPTEYVGQLMRRFVDKYFPADLPVLTPKSEAAAHVARYAGRYGPSVRSRTTWEKRTILGNALVVHPLPDGLSITTAAGEVSEWVALDEAAGALRKRNGDETIAFSEGLDGNIYLLGEDAFAPYVSLSLAETDSFDRTFTQLCTWSFALAIAVALVSLGFGGSAPYRLVQGLLATVGTLDLAILHAMIRTARWDTYQFLATLPWPLLAATALALASALLTLAIVALVAWGWRRNDWTIRGRLSHTLLAIPATAFLWWLWFWNLLGFRFA